MPCIFVLVLRCVRARPARLDRNSWLIWERYGRPCTFLLVLRCVRALLRACSALGKICWTPIHMSVTSRPLFAGGLMPPQISHRSHRSMRGRQCAIQPGSPPTEGLGLLLRVPTMSVLVKVGGGGGHLPAPLGIDAGRARGALLVRFSSDGILGIPPPLAVRAAELGPPSALLDLRGRTPLAVILERYDGSFPRALVPALWWWLMRRRRRLWLLLWRRFLQKERVIETDCSTMREDEWIGKGSWKRHTDQVPKKETK